jgi:hypothetical protein
VTGYGALNSEVFPAESVAVAVAYRWTMGLLSGSVKAPLTLATMVPRKYLPCDESSANTSMIFPGPALPETDVAVTDTMVGGSIPLYELARLRIHALSVPMALLAISVWMDSET